MYFLISDELVERNDLGIYEKMALVVLAKYSNGSQQITREMLVEKMGAGKVEFGAEYTDIAIKKLIKHGLLTIANSEELEVLELMDFAREKPEFERISRQNEDFPQEANPLIQEESHDDSSLNSNIEMDEKSKEEKESTLNSYSNSERLKQMIEKKALEFSDENKFNVIDLSLQENITALESKRGVPIEEIKSIFKEVCTNQKAKILYHLANKDITWLKEAYRIVEKKGKINVLEELAEFLQENTGQSYHAGLHLKKKRVQENKAQSFQTNDFEPESEEKRENFVFDSAQREEDGDLKPEKNAGLDFYNGYDLKSIFANLERKFEYEAESSQNSVHERNVKNSEAADSEIKSQQKTPPLKERMFSLEEDGSGAGKINMRATSFKQAKSLYSTYGNPNLKKNDDAKDKK